MPSLAGKIGRGVTLMVSGLWYLFEERGLQAASRWFAIVTSKRAEARAPRQIAPFVPLTPLLSLICSRVPCEAECSPYRQSVGAERRKLNSYETSISTVQDAPEAAARISESQ